MRAVFALFVVIAVAASCMSRDKSQLKIQDVDQPAEHPDYRSPIKCEAGTEAKSIGLDIKETLPPKESFPFPVEQRQLSHVGPWKNVRIDSCVGDAVTTVKRVVLKYPDPSNAYLQIIVEAELESGEFLPSGALIPTDWIQAEGLHEFYKNGNDTLKLTATLARTEERVTRTLEFETFKHEGKMYGAVYRKRAKRFGDPLSLWGSIYVGQAKVSHDPFKRDATCLMHEELYGKEYKFDDAIVTIDACGSHSGTIFAGWTTLSRPFAATFTKGEMKAEIQKVPDEVKFARENDSITIANDRGFSYTILQGHHNFCDEVQVTVNDLEYRITIGSLGVNCYEDPELPRPDGDEPLGGYPMLSRVNGGPWTAGWATSSPKEPTPVEEPVESDLVHKLDDMASFRALAKQAAPGLSYVKFTHELKEGGLTYFQDSNRYRYHIEYLRAEVEAYEDLSPQEYITKIQGPRRIFSVGAVFHSMRNNLLGIEIYVKDMVPVEELVKVYRKLEASLPQGQRLVLAFEDFQTLNRYAGPLGDHGIQAIPLQQLR